jgi:type II secretory pathway pseudopilin PulG
LRKAFTLIELLVIIAIMGLMVTIGIVNVRSGQGAARTRGAARDVFAVIRHARSTALVTMQPAIVTYSCVMDNDEPMIKIEVHCAKIIESETATDKLQTLSGEPLKVEGENKGESSLPKPDEGGGDQGGETIEDVLFAPISTEVVKGMRIKVVVGDEDADPLNETQRKSKVSVFSNVDYLLGKFKNANGKKKDDAPAQENKPADNLAAADGSLQPELSVVWETNGRTDPHQVWIYPDGSEPHKGLLLKIDRFGAVKVLSGDGREEDE